jgi:hypothetical protein
MTIKRCDICDITNNSILSRNHIKATEFETLKQFSYYVSTLQFFKRKDKVVCHVCEAMHRNALKELQRDEKV